MSATQKALSDSSNLVLSKALLNAGAVLKISQTDLGRIIGKDRTSLKRGINPDSKPGELACLFIRIYRSLFVLVGGDPSAMQHWMKTENSHTGGIPAEQVKTVTGLTHVLEYLDAMRGKI